MAFVSLHAETAHAEIEVTGYSHTVEYLAPKRFSFWLAVRLLHEWPGCVESLVVGRDISWRANGMRGINAEDYAKNTL